MKKATALLILAAGAVAAIGLVGSEPTEGAKPWERIGATGETADHPGRLAPSSGRDALIAKKKKRGKKSGSVKLRNYNSDFYTVEATKATEEFSMTCPKGWRAINGYFGARGPGVVPIGSDPSKDSRKWWFQLFNIHNSTNIEYYTGILCAKGFK